MNIYNPYRAYAKRNRFRPLGRGWIYGSWRSWYAYFLNTGRAS
jgi:hypothetical protein